MTEGTYNPFEDTGDWPFRESAPPPARDLDEAAERPSPGLFDREAHEAAPEPDRPFRLDERRPEAVAELGPEVAPEPEIEPELSGAQEVEIEEDVPAPEAFPQDEPEPHEPF